MQATDSPAYVLRPPIAGLVRHCHTYQRFYRAVTALSVLRLRHELRLSLVCIALHALEAEDVTLTLSVPGHSERRLHSWDLDLGTLERYQYLMTKSGANGLKTYVRSVTRVSTGGTAKVHLNLVLDAWTSIDQISQS
jgi:hypothetical protein